MQGWKTTNMPEVTRKISLKRLNHTRKEPADKRCPVNAKPVRSQVKRKNSMGREFQSLAVWGKKLLV